MLLVLVAAHAAVAAALPRGVFFTNKHLQRGPSTREMVTNAAVREITAVANDISHECRGRRD